MQGLEWEHLMKSEIDRRETGRKGMDWTYLAQDRHKSAGCCEHCIETMGSTKLRELLGQLRNCFLLKKNFGRWSLLTSLGLFCMSGIISSYSRQLQCFFTTPPVHENTSLFPKYLPLRKCSSKFS